MVSGSHHGLVVGDPSSRFSSPRHPLFSAFSSIPALTVLAKQAPKIYAQASLSDFVAQPWGSDLPIEF